MSEHTNSVSAVLILDLFSDPGQIPEFVEVAYKFTTSDTGEEIEGIAKVFITGVSQ